MAHAATNAALTAGTAAVAAITLATSAVAHGVLGSTASLTPAALPSICTSPSLYSSPYLIGVHQHQYAQQLQRQRRRHLHRRGGNSSRGHSVMSNSGDSGVGGVSSSARSPSSLKAGAGSLLPVQGGVCAGIVKAYRPEDGVYEVALCAPSTSALGTAFVRHEALSPMVVGRIGQPVLTEYGSGKLEQVSGRASLP